MSTQYISNMAGFIQTGLAADKPVTPNFYPGDSGFYFATDTQALYVWVTDAWVQVSGT